MPISTLLDLIKASRVRLRYHRLEQILRPPPTAKSSHFRCLVGYTTTIDELRETQFPPQICEVAPTTAFDHVFVAQNVKVIHTPIRALNANAYAERWVRSVRQECFDHLIIVNERHLNSVLREYVSYYNTRRPHQGLGQSSPAGSFELINTGAVYCREVLGGLINDYYREVA